MSKSLKNFQFLTGDDGQYDGVENQVKGDKGAPGTNGADGQKGQQGPKGGAGEKGAVTTIVGSWTTNSVANLPKNGTFPPDWDFAGSPPSTFQVNTGESMQYLPASTADPLYGHLFAHIPGANTSGWTDIGVLGAVKGTTGATGAQGDKGSKGEPGAAGTNGSNGSAGAKGQKGAPADKGQKGSVGADGGNGEKGAVGERGPKGEVGEKGVGGAGGSKGEGGTKGSTGSKGSTGASGLSGSKGQKGDNAESGGIASTVVAFDMTSVEIGASVTPICQHNITAVTRIDSDTFRIRFQRKLPNVNYAVIAQAGAYRILVMNRTQWTVLIKSPTGLSEYCNVLIFHPDANNISNPSSGY